MNSAHGVAGGRRRHSGGEGAKRKGNDEAEMMTRSRHQDSAPCDGSDAKNGDHGGLTDA